MSTGSHDYDQLTQKVAEIRDLERIAALSYWDMQTYMPQGGHHARAEQQDTLQVLIHEKMADPQLGALIDALREKITDPDTIEAATLHWLARDHKEATQMPPELVREKSQAASNGMATWLKAREENDFQIFLPALKQILKVSRATARAIKPDSDPLATLLDQREPGFSLGEINQLFSQLRDFLVPLLNNILHDGQPVDSGILREYYDPKVQWEAGFDAAKQIGFDLDKRGRKDISVHPFTTAFSPDDVRITTRLRNNYFPTAFFATLHEAGHGTYEQGIPASLARSVLGNAPSGGFHESQSRLWENLVGRSRPFWNYFFPRLQQYFPNQLRDVSLETFYRAVNDVKPSLIRVEADEVTYNLHIIIRFELERDLFKEDLTPADLPDAWNQKYEKYLGITPPDPTQGVLQDIHWSSEIGASFVSYTLGNMISAQLFEQARKVTPKMIEGFGQGDFSPLLEWMQENVHAVGRRYEPKDLLKRITGDTLRPEPFMHYLTDKMKDVYQLSI